MTDPVVTPTWTSGHFGKRYWGFLWRGVLAGLLSMFLIGPFGLARSLIEILRGHFGDIAGHLLVPVTGSLLSVMYWAPLSFPVTLIPTLLWPRLPLPLDRRAYRALIALAAVSGTFVEVAIALGLFRMDFEADVPIDWAAFLFICHGTGALAGLLVFLWTPEAREYRRRRKAQRATGSPPAAPA